MAHEIDMPQDAEQSVKIKIFEKIIASKGAKHEECLERALFLASKEKFFAKPEHVGYLLEKIAKVSKKTEQKQKFFDHAEKRGVSSYKKSAIFCASLENWDRGIFIKYGKSACELSERQQRIETLDFDALPDEMVIAAVSLAELAAGPHAAGDPAERARRQERLQRVEATFHPLPFDVEAARAYGQIYAAVSALGRSPRRRAMDLLIAATALSAGLPLYTRNPADFEGLAELIEVVAVS